ncbi:MAG: hypothetical protein GC146_02950 [Limimaricola sp.]|uniref:hypothetical protein n=1 Tax=Limimaricola sp. TaxID=2211665 RepID=UPI001D764169|nr:hypothetical protein [Limimaricola sp.]MBI1416158.1 hypothetical protein [Limimaricola sp.]
MSAGAFEAYTTGRTITYAEQGATTYGREHYGPDRTVLWSDDGQTCTAGRWYPNGSRICFVYEDDPTPQCWIFFKTAKGLRALYQNHPGVGPLLEVPGPDAPLACAGPVPSV